MLRLLIPPIAVAAIGVMLLVFLLVFIRVAALNPFAERAAVCIEDGDMQPRRLRVDAGEVLQVRIITDRPVQLRIPGTGIGPVTIGKVADAGDAPVLFVGGEHPGHFAILDDRSGIRLGELIVESNREES